MYRFETSTYDYETKELISQTSQSVERLHQAADLVDRMIETLKHGILDWKIVDKDGNVVNWGKIIGG